MKHDNIRRLRANGVFLAKDVCDLEAFRAIVERTGPAFASSLASNILIYEGTPCARRPRRRALQRLFLVDGVQVRRPRTIGWRAARRASHARFRSRR
jgi:hypothetical protein